MFQQYRALFHGCTVITTLLVLVPCLGEDVLTGAEAEFNHVEKQAESNYKTHEDLQNKSWEEMRKRVLRKWSDGAIPEVKDYVEYFDQDSTRVKVDYENGIVSVEAIIDAKEQVPTSAVAAAKIKSALSTVISQDSKSTTAVLTRDEITASTTSQQDLVASLIQSVESSGGEKGDDGQERRLYRVSFKLVPNYVKRRAAKFRPTVEVWAKKYNLDPAFVLAIMRTESAFNPRARSSVGAIGLMQIMPQYAGLEVMQTVTTNAVQPTAEFLYEPQKNIMIGTTYLQLLRDQYFAAMKDEEKQRYLITASYNWGPHRIKKAIAKGRLSTRVPASDVFSKIQEIAPAETKEYLRKVTQYTADFRAKD